MTVNLTYELMFFLNGRKTQRTFFLVVSSFCQSRDIVVPKLWDWLCQKVWGTLHSLSSAATTCSSHSIEPDLCCHGVIPVPLWLPVELPESKPSHQQSLPPQTWIHPNTALQVGPSCFLPLLVLNNLPNSVHQPWCTCCSRRRHFQGFCWALFRVMWKRVALSLCFFNLTCVVLFLTV